MEGFHCLCDCDRRHCGDESVVHFHILPSFPLWNWGFGPSRYTFYHAIVISIWNPGIPSKWMGKYWSRLWWWRCWIPRKWSCWCRYSKVCGLHPWHKPINACLRSIRWYRQNNQKYFESIQSWFRPKRAVNIVFREHRKTGAAATIHEGAEWKLYRFKKKRPPQQTDAQNWKCSPRVIDENKRRKRLCWKSKFRNCVHYFQKTFNS